MLDTSRTLSSCAPCRALVNSLSKDTLIHTPYYPWKYSQGVYLLASCLTVPSSPPNVGPIGAATAAPRSGLDLPQNYCPLEMCFRSALNEFPKVLQKMLELCQNEPLIDTHVQTRTHTFGVQTRVKPIHFIKPDEVFPQVSVSWLSTLYI